MAMTITDDIDAAALARAFKQFTFPDGPRVRVRDRVESMPNLIALPLTVEAFDWRDTITIAAPVHQGTCNACTSFAIAAAIEAHRQIAQPHDPISVSAGYIHTCLGHDGDADAAQVCVAGVDLFAALTLVQARGYAAGLAGDYPFPAASCAVTAAAGRLRAFSPLPDTDSAKRQIVGGGPIVADMYVWADFFDYSTSRAPTYLPDTTRDGFYLHTVCVVGFNRDGWIIKNSFGPSWGDGRGFAVIGYDACALIGARPPAGGFPREAFAIELEPASSVLTARPT
jgi:hypothetical protein